LESLRQPLETGDVTIARAQSHVRYPARFLLAAAMNPCKCGLLGDVARQCRRAPACGEDYLAKLSGPLLDRIDLTVGVYAVPPQELAALPAGENTETVAARVSEARERQSARYRRLTGEQTVRCNAEADGALLTEAAKLDATAEGLLNNAAKRLALSARGYHRVLRVARTIADLAGTDHVGAQAVAESLHYREVIRTAVRQ
jgi:magnesium chelatase family protein